MTTIDTKHLIKAPRAVRYYHSDIWVTYAVLRDAKDDARSMALVWAGGAEADAEARFRQGKGLWTAVRHIWPKWKERHTEALNLYKQLRGKDMTVEILQNRVHKMYYIYKPSQNIKGHGVSSEHPDGR